MTVELSGIKETQQQTWASGDYARVAATIQIMAELLCEAVDLRGGERVLDVACGSGNASIAAARRFCDVTGIDYVPEVLERGRIRAKAQGLPVTFTQGDAEDIPFPDASFDVVLSTVGVMFAPDQERAAAELLRVCRPGGRIGLASWTPDGFVGAMFRTAGAHVPPPADLRPPVEWGAEARLRELFGDAVTDLYCERRTHAFRYPSPGSFVEFMRAHYGPTVQMFERLGEAGRVQLAADLEELAESYNTADDGTAVIPATYLECVAIRR